MPKTCSIDQIVGARVRQKREERGITPKAFAAALGISEQALLACEAGANRIDARLMMKLCRALDVSAKYFFEPWAPVRSGQISAVPQRPRRPQSFAKALLNQIGHLAKRLTS